MKSKHLFMGVVIAATTLTTSMLLVACSKNNNTDELAASGTQNVSLYLTDGPGRYDKVVLDIKSVEVVVDTSKDTRKHDHSNWDTIGKHGPKPDSALVWQSLQVQAGLYDVLQLRNGIDTLLASSSIVAGSVRLIRINLGNNSSVTKDSVTYPITLPTNADAAIVLKLKGNEFEQYAQKRHRLWLDFDVQRSIIELPNQVFVLRPFLKTFVASATGSISGSVAPREARPVISVFNSSDSAYAIPQQGGMFKIRGLKDGTYQVHVFATNGFKDTTINNVVISNAGNVNLNRIELHK